MIELNSLGRLLLAALTCYRLARMIAQDDGPFFLFKRIRYWAKDKAWFEAENARMINRTVIPIEISDRHFGRWHNLAEGISCAYCVGVWLSLPLFIMWLYPSYQGDLFLVLMSISGVQAFLQSVGK